MQMVQMVHGRTSLDFDYVDIQQNTFVSSQVEYKSRSRGLWR